MFHEHRRLQTARIRSGRLIGLFLILVLIVAGAVGVTVAALTVMTIPHPPLQEDEHILTPFLSEQSLFWGGMASLCVIGLILIVSGWHLVSLSKSPGDTIGDLLGGTKIRKNDPNLPFEIQRTQRIVEEVAMGAGDRAPTLYVLTQEEGINAFAAGTSGNAPVIGVTMGAVRKLDRDEMAAVIAHEMAHIVHKDTVVFTKMMAAVRGLVILSLLGRVLLRAGGGSRRSGRNKGGGQILLLGLALFVLGWIGQIAGHLLQASVSRQREHMADAQAVRFTGNPDALVRVFKKIGGEGTAGRIVSPQAEEARHAFFAHTEGRAKGTFWLKAFATHPPLVERIRALDPTYNPLTDPVWPGGLPASMQKPHNPQTDSTSS